MPTWFENINHKSSVANGFLTEDAQTDGLDETSVDETIDAGPQISSMCRTSMVATDCGKQVCVAMQKKQTSKFFWESKSK